VLSMLPLRVVVVPVSRSLF